MVTKEWVVLTLSILSSSGPVMFCIWYSLFLSPAPPAPSPCFSPLISSAWRPLSRSSYLLVSWWENEGAVLKLPLSDSSTLSAQYFPALSLSSLSGLCFNIWNNRYRADCITPLLHQVVLWTQRCEKLGMIRATLAKQFSTRLFMQCIFYCYLRRSQFCGKIIID